MYLDLEELPRLFDRFWLWSARRFSPVRFHRRDYLGDTSETLRQAVNRTLEELGCSCHDGSIRLLTQVRQLGYVFNPLSMYFCFQRDGSLQNVLAHVSNTPWRENYAYVLEPQQFIGGEPPAQDEFDQCNRDHLGSPMPKQFHVSPFMSMDMEYRWRISQPSQQLRVCLSNWQDDRQLFFVDMQLQRKEISRRSLAWMLLKYPLLPQQIIASIYWQAFRLWWKKTPFFQHPNKLQQRTHTRRQAPTPHAQPQRNSGKAQEVRPTNQLTEPSYADHDQNHESTAVH